MSEAVERFDKLNRRVFRNDSGEEIPAYAVLRITSTITIQNKKILTVAKPNSDNLVLAINGPAKVPISAFGALANESDIRARYSGGSPANGDEWGPKNGSWNLDPDESGYRIIGDADGTTVAVEPALNSGQISLPKGVVKSCIPGEWKNDTNCFVDGEVEIWLAMTPPAWESGVDYTTGDRIVELPDSWATSTAYLEGARVKLDASAWAPSTPYSVGDFVIESEMIYECNTAHTSDVTTFSNDAANWDELAPEKSHWRANTNHTSDATSFNADIANWTLVRTEGQHYEANTNHTSGGTFQGDIANWDKLDCAGWWIDRSGPTEKYIWEHDFTLPEGSRYDLINSATRNGVCESMEGWA